jgi:methylated-DNA-protein-cysteine methyltransferase-like protein
MSFRAESGAGSDSVTLRRARRSTPGDPTVDRATRARVPASHEDDPIARIHATVAAIPRGRVASYGEIAVRAGLPGRARLVGRALRETPAGTQLPWHRVLRASGEFAFPRGSKAFREQQRRLEAEGVNVLRGRVALASFGWGRDVDAELWAPPLAPNRRTKPVR